MEFEKIYIRLDNLGYILEDPRVIKYDTNPHDDCYRDITVSGRIDLRKAGIASLSDWERIRISDDVFITTDILRKALKEYFDRILNVNSKE